MNRNPLDGAAGRSPNTGLSKALSIFQTYELINRFRQEQSDTKLADQCWKKDASSLLANDYWSCP